MSRILALSVLSCTFILSSYGCDNAGSSGDTDSDADTDSDSDTEE